MPVEIRIEPILPNRNFIVNKAARLQSEIVGALELGVTLMLVGALRERSANWSTSPVWNSKVSAGAKITLTLRPTGAGAKKWRWVSGGTKRHDITPKRRSYLVFGSGYVPKTLPGGTFAKSGNGEYIGDTVFTKYVDHPGIDARNFEQDVVDEKEGAVNGAIAAAVARAVS